MEINPFIIAGKIPAPYFCDRQDELKRLTRCIQNQENVVLVSPRRVGKTGLINHCFDQLDISEKYITINIDILHTSSLREFILELGVGVYRKIASRSDRLLKLFAATMRSLSASFGYDPIQGTPTFDIKIGDISMPEYTLEEIFNYLEQADRRCIIAIDEFQQIIYYPEKNVEALLRSHIQRLTNANFIYAGSERRIMSEMFYVSNRPFYQSATSIQLDPISLPVYIDFVQHHFHKAKKKIDAETIEIVYKSFCGVTLYVQRIMHDAYAAIGQGEACTLDFAQQLIEQFVSENATRLREQMAYISEQQKELLYAIFHEGKAERITSSAFIKKHRLRSASAVQSAEKRLLEYDLISKRERTYFISDPLLELWMKQQGF